MFAEVLSEFWHEVSGEPWRLALEVLQFAILAAIIWIGAVGIGKRRGIIVARLATRRDQLGERLARAQGAGDDLALAKKQSAESVQAAQTQARAIVAEAQDEAERLHDETRAEVDAHVELTMRRVEESLSAEAEEVRSSLREHLVEVVALASRSVLSRNVSTTEQRDLIERAILEATATPNGTGPETAPSKPRPKGARHVGH